MSTARRPHRPVVVIVGGGAAGTLTALHLVRTASRRSTGLDITVIDPADRCARGVAFGTRDAAHLLNVPASGMSALPEDPGHFVAWRHRDDPDRPSVPYDFAPREQFGRYLEQTLDEALAAALGDVTLRHLRQRAVQVRRTASGVRVTTDDGRTVPADGLVVATGLPAAGDAWADGDLRRSPFFVPDPWAPGALDVVRRDHAGPLDVLLVGTGLTTVDVVLSLSSPGNRPDRTLHAVSRRGLFPRTHAAEQQLAAIPDVSDWGTPWRRSGPTRSGTWPRSAPRPATGGRPWTGCGSGSVSSGSVCPSRTGRRSWPATPRPGTGTGTGWPPRAGSASTSSSPPAD